MSNIAPKIGFISLGCAKATVDSERIMSHLKSEGYELVDSYDDADLIIINTCAFINEAVQESLDTIGEALMEHGKVIVTGCLGARKETILERYPHVLAITGPNAEDDVLKAVHQHLPKPNVNNLDEEHVLLTPSHYAYLKISEGCNHHCTYCIIPDLRGKLISRPLPDIMDEAEQLVQMDVKELLIVAQDTSAYGLDLHFKTDFWKGKPVKTNLFSLAECLSELGVWIRLHYLYPYPQIDELLPLMAEHKILPYMDVPLQHANPRILKLMRRPAHTENMLERIAHWRKVCPDMTIRSTFIVGFPGETDEEFCDLLSFLEAAQLDRVGCFKYSPVKGARANELPDYVPEDVKEDRLQQLLLLQADISAEKLKQKIGQTLDVMIDEVNESEIIGRTQGDAPDVDGLVMLKPHSSIQSGDIVKVLIEDSDDHDLFGKII